MENAPKVTVEFLADYELEIMNTSEQHTQSNIATINEDASFKGKKGLHLCGGSVDADTGEVSGCILDGTYTFYKSDQDGYLGFLGNCLSNNDYTFSTPQQITFRTENDGTYIKSILVYFDSVAGEYATDLYFSNAIKSDGTTDSRYTSSFKIKNKKLLFMFSFGENSDITQITLNFQKWSKKNAFLKVVKIKTGYTGIYDYATLMSLKWDDDKFSDETELKFGISTNTASFEVIDNDDIISEMYIKNLIFRDVIARIYMDDILQGWFYLDQKSNERGSPNWVFDCVDFMERIKDDIVPVMQIDDSGNCTLANIISWVCNSKGIQPEYSDEALSTCNNYYIPKAYIRSGQNVYEVLLKVCQAGLLRMYVSVGKLKIVKGV